MPVTFLAPPRPWLCEICGEEQDHWILPGTVPPHPECEGKKMAEETLERFRKTLGEAGK